MSLLGSIAFLLLVELRILSLFGRNLPRVVSVAFNREASELDPGGLCKAWWVSGMAWECLTPEAHYSLVTFSRDSRALGIPSILPWKAVYCLLGILDMAGIVCLYYFLINLEEKELVYLTATAWGFLYCFLNWNFCLETEFYPLSVLPSLKGGKSEHCFLNILVKKSPKWNLYEVFYYFLLLFYFYFVNIT